MSDYSELAYEWCCFYEVNKVVLDPLYQRGVSRIVLGRTANIFENRVDQLAIMKIFIILIVINYRDADSGDRCNSMIVVMVFIIIWVVDQRSAETIGDTMFLAFFPNEKNSKRNHVSAQSLLNMRWLTFNISGTAQSNRNCPQIAHFRTKK